MMTLEGGDIEAPGEGIGPFRGLNSGPPAPKAGIIPLDQMDSSR